MQKQKRRNRIWKWVRRVALAGAVAVLLLVLVVLFWLRGALYNHFVRFPGEAAAWADIRARRQAVTNSAGWSEYRGILHSHSHLSHDSEVPFENILRALKTEGIDFICLSDHCNDSLADFNAQWRGLHEGKLFIPGFEMKEGIMPFGVASNVVLSSRTDSSILCAQIVTNGGVLFYAHPEERRVWERPELTGMEIYNIHTDFKAGVKSLNVLVPDLILNQRQYPDQVFRLMFRPPTTFLEKWDELNWTRHITGIAGNDCHQNTGFRGFVTETNTIYIEDTSPKRLKVIPLTAFKRRVATWLFGPLEPGKKIFHVQLDPYERMGRYVNTHVLAKELSEAAVLDALRASRVFIGFDMIADSTGFRWLAANSRGQVVMGETLEFGPETRLEALSPHRCRFSIVKDGARVFQAEGYAAQWNPPRPGKYRVEAELNIRDEWVPWIYSNPIELK